MKRRCLVVSDTARARIYTFEYRVEPDGPHEEFREILDLVELGRRQRLNEQFSDNSGGSRNGVHDFGYDDHRQGHLDEVDRRFANEIVEATTRAVAEHACHELILVASSRMFGKLRTAFEPLRRSVTITEVERDLTNLPPAELREHLAGLDLLPPRPSFVVAAQ